MADHERQKYYDRVVARKPELENLSSREIEYRSIKPRPITVQISLKEYFERIKRHKADAWQIDLCQRLQDAAANRHIERWWGIVHAEGQLGKPVHVETPVLMGDGSYKRLGDVVVGDSVITHKARPRRVRAVHDQGDLPVLKIITNCGREILTALDHPFLTPEGWIEAKDLAVGQVLGSVARANTKPIGTRTADEFEMLGYFIGDGCVVATAVGSIQAGITSGDPVQAARILHIADSFGWGYRVTSKPGAKCFTYHFKGGVRPWLRETGIAGHGSFTKRVPEWVFQGSSEKVAAFIGAYFSCDGSIGSGGIGGRNKVVDFYSVSRGLLEDVQRLLLRLGIQSYIRVKNGRYNHKSHLSYRLYFCSQDYNATFAAQVPIAGKKGQLLLEMNPLRRTFDSPLLEDPIVSIEPAGVAPCKCLTVVEDSTFTANDIVVHNTSIISQCFPAWLLGHDPLFRFALAMYNVSRSQNHSSVVIQIMQSNLHRDIFTDKSGWLFEDAGASFGRTISKAGWKTVARKELNDGQESFNPVGLRSGLTGAGYDWLGIDDPYKEAQEAFSTLINEQMHNFYDYTVQSRTGLHSCISGMFHRYAPEDFAGFLLDTGDFEYLRYATQADGDYIHESTGKRYPDPLGRAEGAYISPDRRPPAYYAKSRENNRVWLSMFQGKPSSDEGDFFNIGKLGKLSPEKAEERLRECSATARAYDIASTEEAGAYSVGAKMGIRPNGHVTIFDIWRQRVDTAVRMAKQKELAEQDGTSTTVVIPIDPGAAGISVVWYTEQELEGFTVVGRTTSGSKVQRAMNFSHAVNSGKVEYVDEAEWFPAMRKELRDFPLSDYKDIVDALSDGYSHLYEVLKRGLIVKNYLPQRNLVEIKDFQAKFALDEFEIPEKWAVYAAVKISQEASRATSAVITTRASAHSALPETLFVIDEYKAYDANMYALFDWIDERMKTFAKGRDITIWLHPDSEQYYQTIASKLNYRVSKFTDDDLAGHNELNWYLMPTELAHPFGHTESAAHLYFLTDQIAEAEKDTPHGFYHARQEIATWGFNDKGDPTKVGDVMDCLRMITHRFKTYEEPFTLEEEFDMEVKQRMPDDGPMTREKQHQLTWAKRNAMRAIEDKYGEGVLTEPEYFADLFQD